MSEGRPRPFHERFDIAVDVVEARQQFINRMNLLTFEDMTDGDWRRELLANKLSLYDLTRFVAFSLGERMPNQYHPATLINNDFHRCLRVLESLYRLFEGTGLENRLSDDIQAAIRMSPVDLDVAWQPPVFVRTGARLLDESLVNEPLRWLSDPTYQTVLAPFQRGLSHYLEDRLSDAVTDMYETVEALARILTGKDNDLSGNRESFIKSIKVSYHYKRLLKNYIEYGSEFRHAERLNRPRPKLTEPEVEAFVYLTGLFIRLAIRSTD